MKRLLTLLAVLFMYTTSSYAVVNVAIDQHNLQGSFENLDPMVQNMDIENFLTLTPKQYRKMTGKRLGVKKALQLKAAQKVIKKATGQASDIPKGLYIVGVILGFAWILMGVMDDFQGNNWWVNLLLYIVCFIPGLVHGFIKMGDYY